MHKKIERTKESLNVFNTQVQEAFNSIFSHLKLP